MSFKINNEVYSVGECVQIFDEGQEHLVAKIIKILPANGIQKYSYWPTIEIQWYYRKSDIAKDSKLIPGLKLECISDYEVFESNHKDVIFIETIVGKCSILRFEEYEQLDEINGNMFYKRAFYDPIKVRHLL